MCSIEPLSNNGLESVTGLTASGGFGHYHFIVGGKRGEVCLLIMSFIKGCMRYTMKGIDDVVREQDEFCSIDISCIYDPCVASFVQEGRWMG